MDLEIRAFADADADEDRVVTLWNACFPDPPAHNAPQAILARKRGVHPELLRVALRDGRIVGTAVGGWDGYRGWVYHVATEPGLRRQGIGAALMRDVEERLRELGCPKLNLQVLADNEEVARFYRSLGYRLEERLDFGKLLLDE